MTQQDVSAVYDPKAGVFLADRFVKGTCPKCGTPDQYGDSCEKCQSTYSASELKDPVSTLSGATPEVRTARHLFVNIERLHGFLEEWTQSGRHLQSEVANYLRGHFFKEPLRDWDVSRPAPYFGFEIPDSPGNYWYVWFDAPIGNLASTQRMVRPGRGEKLNGQSSAALTLKSITLSVRTSPISTRCSGPPCSKRPATSCRGRFTSTAS